MQAEIERGVAMLHSLWFSATEKTFRRHLPDLGVRWS
jgi:hypothetical protein